MNTEGIGLENQERKKGKDPINGLFGLAFGALLLFFARDIVDAIWIIFRIPF